MLVVGKLQSMGQMQLLSVFVNSHQKVQKRVVETETVWPAKPKMVTV